MCPNLKKVKLKNVLDYLKENKDFLPKSQYFEEYNFSSLTINSENVNKLKILLDKYSKTMKTLDVMLFELIAEEWKTSIDCIYRFENLKRLRLVFHLMKTTEPIDDCLSLIGQKCTKLLQLELIIYNSGLDHFLEDHVGLTDQFFSTFSQFKSIRYLYIRLFTKTVLPGSVECFKHCTELIELYITYPELREDFFTNIHLFVQKLQFLSISNSEIYSDSFIDSFLSMKCLENVYLFRQLYRFSGFTYTETILRKHWYFGKSFIEKMLSRDGINVIRVNDNCGLITTRFRQLQD